MAGNPRAFVSAITKQVRADLERENEQRAQEDQFIKTFEDFQKQHPGFQEKWDSGEIKQFMDAHPGHNALSSYLALTDKARIEKAVAQILQEQGLGGDAPLDDAKKHGGDTRLLADRLRALRSGGGGKVPPSGDPETGELKPTM